MKTSILLTSLGLAGISLGQFQGLPSCATECAEQFLAGNGIANCGNDAKCICGNKQFISDIACCLAKPGGCSPADQSSAVTFASQICVIQGISVPSVVSCASATDAPSSTTSGGATDATNTSAGGSNTSPTGTGATTGSTAKAGAPRETGMPLLAGLVAVGAALL